MSIPTGTDVAITGFSSGGPTHQVVGHAPHGYAWICPLAELGNVDPGQTTVPVTKISEDSLVLFGEAVSGWNQVVHLDGWQIKQLFSGLFVGTGLFVGGSITNDDKLTVSVTPQSANVMVEYLSADGSTKQVILEADEDNE